MAMQYVYTDQSTKELVKLKNFGGLQYSYDDYNECLEIFDSQGEHVAFFYVKPHTCYLLQRRNQSQLQLHEVTPPSFCMDQILWLFGFGRKHRCESRDSFAQACAEYQKAHPDLQVIVKEAEPVGVRVKYAFAWGRNATLCPVACFYEIAEGTTWAFFGKEAEYRVIAAMHKALGNFHYPLQYVIHLFKGVTMSYPVETRKFFQEELGYYAANVYYASGPEGGF